MGIALSSSESKRAAGQHCFEHFLAADAKEERHADIIDQESQLTGHELYCAK